MNRLDFDRLKEIQSEMLDLIEEASRLVRQADKQEYERAKGYWIGNIKMSLGDQDYLTHSPTMQNTINLLNPIDTCVDCEVELTSDNSDDESDYCNDCLDEHQEATDEDFLGESLKDEHNNPHTD